MENPEYYNKYFFDNICVGDILYVSNGTTIQLDKIVIEKDNDSITVKDIKDNENIKKINFDKIFMSNDRFSHNLSDNLYIKNIITKKSENSIGIFNPYNDFNNNYKKNEPIKFEYISQELARNLMPILLSSSEKPTESNVGRLLSNSINPVFESPPTPAPVPAPAPASAKSVPASAPAPAPAPVQDCIDPIANSHTVRKRSSNLASTSTDSSVNSQTVRRKSTVSPQLPAPNIINSSAYSQTVIDHASQSATQPNMLTQSFRGPSKRFRNLSSPAPVPVSEISASSSKRAIKKTPMERKYYKIELIPVVYNSSDDTTDFSKMIDLSENDDSLFIFNDNVENHYTSIPGGGNAVIRPYNLYGYRSKSLKKPKSAGIVTGISGVGFRNLTTMVLKESLLNFDKIIGESYYENLITDYNDWFVDGNISAEDLIVLNIHDIAIKILKSFPGQYNKIYYSIDKTNSDMLGSGIFEIGEDVKKFIVNQIRRTPLYVDNKFIKEVRIKGPLGKIFATSDIHGDIMPLLVNMRDLCQIIKKKDGYPVPSANTPDNDAIAELKKPYNQIARHRGDGILDCNIYKEDLNYEWCGDNSIFVICGDIIDNVRSAGTNKPHEFPMEEAKILMFINAINKQAMACGGRIFKVIGNHELMNLQHNALEYISKYAHGNGADKSGNYPDPKDSKLKEKMETSHGPTTNRAMYFLPENPGAFMLAEDNIYACLAIRDFIFVHGGIAMDSVLNYYQSIENANNYLNQYIRGKLNTPVDQIDPDPEYVFMDNYMGEEKIEKQKQEGLTWTRYFGSLPTNTSRSENIGLMEDNMCGYLIKQFQHICNSKKDVPDTNYEKVSDTKLETNYTNESKKYLNIISNFWVDFKNCVPDKLKLVIGHCVQHPKMSNLYNTKKFTKRTKQNRDYIDYRMPMIEATYDKPSITASCGDNDNPSIFRVDIGVSRGFNALNEPRNPQVLVMDYNYKSRPRDDPLIRMRESKNGNNDTHIPDWCSKPSCNQLPEYAGGNKVAYLKYLKYKAKYLRLKNN